MKYENTRVGTSRTKEVAKVERLYPKRYNLGKIFFVSKGEVFDVLTEAEIIPK